MHRFFFPVLKASIQCLAYKHVDEVFVTNFLPNELVNLKCPFFFLTRVVEREKVVTSGTHVNSVKGPPVTSSNFLCRNLLMNLSFPSSLNCVFGHETEACNYHFYFDNNINEEDSAKPIMHPIFWYLSFFLYFK